MVKIAHAQLEPITSRAHASLPEAPGSDWRAGLPLLAGNLVSLRELQVSDAPALYAALTTEQATRFLTPPPSSVEGFEAFIRSAQGQRASGQFLCYAVVPHGSDMAIGMFQVRALEPGFGTAEWGFAIDSEFWGTGIFVDASKLVVDFAFDVLGVHRLEAREAVKNGRGNGALQKLGAVQEGLLRRALPKNGEYLDQMLWTIRRDEWFDAKIRRSSRIILH
jgi:ribosomal-protein-alanine N-acetyltransferase